MLETIVDAVMDTLEEFFESFTVPTGKSLIQTWIVLLGFLVVSIVTQLLGVPCFMQWQEALTAVIVVGIILLIDSGVRASINNVTNKLKDRIIEYREVEDDD